MGSSITVTTDCLPENSTRLVEVQSLFNNWENKFSRFLENSELSQVNRKSGNEVTVSTEFLELVQAAKDAFINTGGLVNATMLGQIEHAGYFGSLELVQEKDQFGPWSPTIANSSPLEVEIDTNRGTIYLPPGIRLDLGGLVKGWAAHKAAIHMAKFGPTLVNAGGDIHISGPQLDKAPWPITIEHPFYPGESIANIGVPSGSIATSGTYRRKWRLNGNIHHHLIDPRTGAPSQSDVVSATAITQDPLLAEASAKAILLLGTEKGMEWAEQHEVAVFIVTATGQAQFDQRMKQYFWS